MQDPDIIESIEAREQGYTMSSEKVEEKAGFHDATNEPDVAKGEVQERGIHVSEKGGKSLQSEYFDDHVSKTILIFVLPADAAAILAAKGFGIAIDPAESERVRKKIDRYAKELERFLNFKLSQLANNILC